MISTCRPWMAISLYSSIIEEVVWLAVLLIAIFHSSVYKRLVPESNTLRHLEINVPNTDVNAFNLHEANVLLT